jgi:type III secretion system low calcium response chaperone LcrH/SycD
MNHTNGTDEEIGQMLLEAIMGGGTIKDIQGVSDDMLEGVYAYAYQFYNDGRLDEAETFFRFLCLYDFYNGEYVLGLGAVHQLKKEFQKAIDMYALAFALTKDDYRPMFQAGQCNLALQKLPVAIECFNNVVNHSQDEQLRERAAIYLNAIRSPSASDTPEETPS